MAKRRRKRRQNPLGIPWWMLLGGTAALYYLVIKKPALTGGPYGGAIEPEEPALSREDVQKRGGMLEGVGNYVRT